ncbi:uncharacterized protein LOC133177179 [Saccostrea echinata]|uniref:uncharacterized protein LOC133177179 n=1 Tax=Saccostrea echinata TaxID=191078 RepID=UPI002A82CA62|nr:uncharacterized protein LOC133177179 [Saccostrea echinata]
MNINICKAQGPDKIPNIVLKTCATQLAPGLAIIFQHSVDAGKLRHDWLCANIAPVFKKGDVHLAENYRPVSLTCVVCKLLEHVICKHILDHLEENNILTHYGVNGSINAWLSDFLTNRLMKVVVDGEESEAVEVVSGVPQGTVLGPRMFLSLQRLT